jgi:peptide/nickel transport system permease protein
MRASYILKRFALMILTLWVLITLVFFLFRLIPADPTALFIGPSLDAASQKQLHKQFGLDKSLPEQYVIYMVNMFQGEFGISIRTNRPVLGMLSGKIVNTLWMMGTSMSFALGLGIIIGTILAWKRGTGVDTGGIALFLALRSAPEFWLGMILLVIFGFQLQWFPIGLMLTPGHTYTGFLDKYFSLDFLHHLFLPVFTMTIFYLATPMLVTRNSILDVLHEDFIEMAHAKGLSPKRIMFRYALRNALLPVVTIAPLMLGFAIGGQVLLEKVFSWPGMGRELVEAVSSMDYPVVQAAFLFLGSIVIIGNFLADILYMYLDPRVKVG